MSAWVVRLVIAIHVGLLLNLYNLSKFTTFYVPTQWQIFPCKENLVKHKDSRYAWVFCRIIVPR